MSAILSADDLNDFISPGVACIKPVETLPAAPSEPSNPYEVTTEDKVTATEAKLQAAQISLTDCLACSGCVTSAEAVLVSLQSHQEVLTVLDSEDSCSVGSLNGSLQHVGAGEDATVPNKRKRIFIASVSPQTRASLAAAMGRSTDEIGHMIDRLLLESISSNGKRGFDYVLDTAPFLSVCLHLAAQELADSLANRSEKAPKLPILTSECPGFVCYLEKTHPAVLPHLSRLKSPQALLGTLLKSLLPRCIGDDIDVYHVAVMPCFDKKLEASRAELTDATWKDVDQDITPTRDVDCVITTRELLQLADFRDVDFSTLSPKALPNKMLPPIPALQTFLLGARNLKDEQSLGLQVGTSGGYLVSIMQELQLKHTGSKIIEKKGRNSDVMEFILLSADGETEILKMARFYGFRNIQNLVRKLKPAKLRMLPGGAARKVVGKTARAPTARAGTSSSVGSEYCYAEVMACPGGCTNGGGQLKFDDSFIVDSVAQATANAAVVLRSEAKAWLGRVDEAYFSADEDAIETGRKDLIVRNRDSRIANIDQLLEDWVADTRVPLDKLVYTTYRAVESNVGKVGGEMSTLQAAELAQKVGGGW
ncbi:Cytosolic Fe-S cluster assembly factor nar1 [Orbilia oligospora]|uniref:Cytosolic Fe-S cluster assembly factor NAR1 n=2 Tax=Orbilia oligospora TaxID=2813651 RepID=A0A7C8J846_ORBOL|nr:Cytosolic Fe-S cluster assembly factor nar1 [Orbilia oligospora]KAF3092778.1 Cytosolic Fe-S cluster assembly factor nar1 [Orbilia oligospora]KAF3095139.1 Cytosolic Fe-S cluster assembly factor nar1 [Orbilia oligospora]KAF3150065.1 Cytosolic Fe-S cluster assembly factor nar1 [Orbilia oligospora]